MAPTQLVEISLESLHPSPDNRPVGDVSNLAASMREVGVLLPLLIRPDDDLPTGEYRIIAGERRWTAARLADLEQVPCLMHDAGDALELISKRLIENLHRVDLGPLDEAREFGHLRDLGKSQREIADLSGYSQPHVNKTLSLLTLPAEAMTALEDGRITKTAALAIVGLSKHKERLKTITAALQGDAPAAELEKLITAEVNAAQVQKNRDARTAEIRARAKKVAPEGYVLVTLVLGVETMERLRDLALLGHDKLPSEYRQDTDRGLMEYIDQKIGLARELEPEVETEASDEIAGEGVLDAAADAPHVEEPEVAAEAAITEGESPSPVLATPWDHYDEMTVDEILAELDTTGCTQELTAQVRSYEAANGGRAAIVSRCSYFLATSSDPGQGDVVCTACGLRPAEFTSPDDTVKVCWRCNEIEERRIELHKELARGDAGVKRGEEIQTELDGLFVDQYQIEAGDVVNDNGSITRAAEAENEPATAGA